MNADERGIRELIARWHQATADGDVDAILPLMSEDVAFLTPGNEPMRGRKQFEAALRNLLKSHRVDSSGEVQEIQVSGNLAYAWTRLNVSVAPLAGGPAQLRSGNTLSILNKTAGGSWVLTRDANLLPPAG